MIRGLRSVARWVGRYGHVRLCGETKTPTITTAIVEKLYCTVYRVVMAASLTP